MMSAFSVICPLVPSQSGVSSGWRLLDHVARYQFLRLSTYSSAWLYKR